MLLAVMGSGSHLKRPWDDRDFDRSPQQHIGVSTSATDSGRRFSVDATSPIQRKLPPILTGNEFPSQVPQGHSWSISAEPREGLSGNESPPPHTEGTLKRRRLSYEHKESTSTEGFDFKASTGNSSVSVSQASFCTDNKQCTPCACLHRLTEYASGLR
jgi:hypothetical protein